LLDTSYNRDLLPGLKAGEYGASFRFRVVQEEVRTNPPRRPHNKRGLAERIVIACKVREFGPVTFPAYEDATAAARAGSYLRSVVSAPAHARSLLTVDAPRGLEP
jgi:phage head maturation protease